MDIPIAVESKSRYKYLPFFGDKLDGVETLAYAFSAADLFVGRASAGLITEAAAFGVPAILVPLEGHQKDNAYAISEAGGAIVIEGGNLNPSIFMVSIKKILDGATHDKMSEAMKKIYQPNAVNALAEEIFQLAK
jgi:UDP-N-acetylglucosamine--N-acetylmuramyl-(pentapeptide) pyrophosphoryl-undecaprenol N-acetylglucosamine transferase